MIKNSVVCDFEQTKLFEKFFDLITKAGLINLRIEDIQTFLKGAKSITRQSVSIKKAIKEEIEKSGILSEELQKSHKCIINITANADITLSDISTILDTILSFHDCECVFSSLYDEHLKEIQIDVFLARV